MELYQLKYFIYVSKYENITKAAQELHVTQPSISKAIKALEDELQIQLLIRNGKRLCLTRAGQLFQARLIPIMDRLEEIPDELHYLGKNKDVIKLNILSCNLLLSDMIKKYKKLKPNVMFIISEKREKTDYDLCIKSALPGISYCHGIKLLDEKIYIASAKDSWLTQKDKVTLNELSDETFIMLNRGAVIRELSEKHFREAGFIPNIGFECDTLYIVKHLVLNNLGITIWPEYSWGSEHSIHLTKVAEPEFYRSIFLMQQTDREVSETVKDFSSFVIEYMKKL